MIYQVENYVRYILAVFSFVFIVVIFCIKPEDSLVTDPVNNRQVSHQKRSIGNKDLWIAKDGQRLHYHMENLSSTLTIIPTQEGLEFIENMDHIRCWLQEKIFSIPPRQKIRYFKSSNGMYLYKQHQLLVQDVVLAVYEQNGTDLVKEIQPSSLLFKGKAKEASFNITGNKVDFFANNFEAVLEDELK